MTNQDEIILDTDPRAAEFRTVQGWVSRDGRFFGDNEDAARYSGCTHRKCRDCDNPARKSWLICDACRARVDREKHAGRKVEPWDGTTMLFSNAMDEYFWDAESLADELHERGMRAEDAMIVLCDPIYPKQIDPDDYYSDELPEDGDVPEEIAKAFDALNAILEKQPPLSWYPGNVAVDVASLGIKEEVTE
jgi:hypothetical protein